MAHRSKPSGENESSEYATFETALKKVLSVPHSKIKNKLNTEKRRRAQSFRFPRGSRKGLVSRYFPVLASDFRKSKPLSRNLR